MHILFIYWLIALGRTDEQKAIILDVIIEIVLPILFIVALIPSFNFVRYSRVFRLRQHPEWAINHFEEYLSQEVMPFEYYRRETRHVKHKLKRRSRYWFRKHFKRKKKKKLMKRLKKRYFRVYVRKRKRRKVKWNASPAEYPGAQPIKRRFVKYARQRKKYKKHRQRFRWQHAFVMNRKRRYLYLRLQRMRVFSKLDYIIDLPPKGTLPDFRTTESRKIRRLRFMDRRSENYVDSHRNITEFYLPSREEQAVARNNIILVGIETPINGLDVLSPDRSNFLWEWRYVRNFGYAGRKYRNSLRIKRRRAYNDLRHITNPPEKLWWMFWRKEQ